MSLCVDKQLEEVVFDHLHAVRGGSNNLVFHQVIFSMASLWDVTDSDVLFWGLKPTFSP
jgi:hypothetical protein